ncbi:MAG: flagellar hook-length control protein FliK [Rhodospirillales bacterium]|nr:flagellar hook-length control protein FliK [Rhodospirillales bacterium]
MPAGGVAPPAAAPVQSAVPPPRAQPSPVQAPSAADQVAPALITLTSGPDGARHLTLRLQPQELGQVDIRIERSADGPARVEITVERPETLRLMLHDQPRLERALDQAGIPAEGRSLVLHVAPPEPGRDSANGGAGHGQGAAGWWTQAGGGGSDLAGGQPHAQGGRGGPPSGQGGVPDEPDTAADQGAQAALTPRRAGWLRAGLDITA